MAELWPGSGDRPVNMADRLAHMVRRMPDAEWKQLSVDLLDDKELATLLVHLDELCAAAGKRLWQRFHSSSPRCEQCGTRHWPEDPHDPKEQE